MEFENTTIRLDIIFLWLMGIIFGIFIIVSIVIYLKERFEDIKYAKMELYRASDKEEYLYWRKELAICRLLIIPFMTCRGAKRIVRLFSLRKHGKKENRCDRLTNLLLPSVLGIIFCSVCLASGTFAWFTASQTTATQTITAANYTVETTVYDGAGNIESVKGNYNLESNKTYTVTIKAIGSASTGYCIVSLGGTDIHTEQFPTQDRADKKSLTFTLEINQAVNMEIVAQWGTSTKSDDNKVKDGGLYTHGNAVPTVPADTDEKIEQVTTEQTTESTNVYSVVSGDTLIAIASKYNMDVEKLVAYNKLTSTNIQAGQKLKIPPSDYLIPQAESTATVTEQDIQAPIEPPPSVTEPTNQPAKADEISSEADDIISNTSD